MKWDNEFHSYLRQLDKKKPVILAGDLNVAHEEIGIIILNFHIILIRFLMYQLLLIIKFIYRSCPSEN